MTLSEFERLVLAYDRINIARESIDYIYEYALIKGPHEYKVIQRIKKLLNELRALYQEDICGALNAVENEKHQIQEAAKMLSKKGTSHGGHARAAKLTPEEREEIARKAARARWDKRTKAERKKEEYSPGEYYKERAAERKEETKEDRK